MVSIESKIEAVVNKLTEKHTYMYESWYSVNREIDKLAQEDFPLCINIIPRNGNIVIKKNMMCDSPYIFIFFLRLSRSMDEKGNGNALAINKCKETAKEFIHRCNESGYFDPIYEQSIVYDVVDGKTDSDLVGVGVSFQITEHRGSPICPSGDTYPVERKGKYIMPSEEAYPTEKVFDNTYTREFE